jgi:hypothetical protein
MNQPAIFSDRRQNPRARVLKGAKIIFNGRTSVLDCTMRNFSDGGACLVLAAPAILPPEFELSLDNLATMRSCRVVWHFDRRMGVAF